jgi:hypothetical protein
MIMSLTNEDYLQIKLLMEEVLDARLSPLTGEITALRNDIKEIYNMIAQLQKNSVLIDESFNTLPVKEQIFQLNAAVVALAQKEGITLPR